MSHFKVHRKKAMVHINWIHSDKFRRLTLNTTPRQHLSSFYIFSEILGVKEGTLSPCGKCIHHFLPPSLKLGQGNVFTLSVILFMGGGVCLSACWDTHPLGRHPPGQTPPGRHPLCSACWDTVNKQAVCILLECNLVKFIISLTSGSMREEDIRPQCP